MQWLLPEVVARYRFERWLNARTLPFPGEPERTCDTVAAWEHKDGTAPPLATFIEFLTELRKGVWSELAKPGTPIDIYRRNLHRSYLDNIVVFASLVRARDS